jgi:hypothetical protein
MSSSFCIPAFYILLVLAKYITHFMLSSEEKDKWHHMKHSAVVLLGMKAKPQLWGLRRFQSLLLGSHSKV